MSKIWEKWKFGNESDDGKVIKDEDIDNDDDLVHDDYDDDDDNMVDILNIGGRLMLRRRIPLDYDTRSEIGLPLSCFQR